MGKDKKIKLPREAKQLGKAARKGNERKAAKIAARIPKDKNGIYKI